MPPANKQAALVLVDQLRLSLQTVPTTSSEVALNFPNFSSDVGSASPQKFARLVIALSGGLDSMALLHMVANNRAWFAEGTKILAVHVNHQIHLQAEQWAQHCRSVCASLQVELNVHDVVLDSRGNLEGQARQLRYGVFESILQAGDVLLMAHHQNDQQETILQRLFRGRGILPMRKSGRLGAAFFFASLAGCGAAIPARLCTK